uniref:Uncharacterized protein n=1 Tax=Cacopsylla melanoneura TaxID=428564 RepID=A0A8D8XNF0_9HEMI
MSSPDPKKKKFTRGSQDVLTEKLSILLDRCKVSDRDAVRVLFSTAEALGHDAQDLLISKSTVRRRRQKFREERFQVIKDKFKNSDLENAVLHWDGKLLPAVLNKDLVERLAILVSSGDEEHLISVPKLENSMGATQAKAVHEEIMEWCITDKIEAMCFDTTAVNTGRSKGACVLLERLLGKVI